MSEILSNPAALTACVILVLAFIPAMVTVWNHSVFKQPPESPPESNQEISILIPARNEESNIGSAVEAALASEGVNVEVVVLDDHSTDRTASIVREIAETDPRLRLESAPELPPGWCGKQHACARLAEHATHEMMLFVDADVVMDPAAPARLASFLESRKAGLVSAFPHQETGSFLEKLLIPLIEFILLGYLPIQMGRWFRSPGFGAGCGQVFLADRSAYRKVGGHSVIKESLHDGVKLPRAFRSAGFQTDICSGHGLFRCRMYHDAEEVWSGLLKNAHEGIANPGTILPFTVFLIGGSVAPFVLAALFPSLGIAWWLGLSPLLLAMLPRTLNTLRFRQNALGWLLHPISVILFLVIQWQALFRFLAGKKPTWKGRAVG